MDRIYLSASWQIPVVYGSMLHVSPTNSYLLAAKQKLYQKAYLLTKNSEELFGKSTSQTLAQSCDTVIFCVSPQYDTSV